MSKLQFAKRLPQNNRPQVMTAVQRIVDRYEADATHTSICLPPRFGKSSIIRLAALELNALTQTPAIMTAPWTDNVDQIFDINKINQMYLDYGVDPSTPFLTHRVRHLETHRWWKLVD